MRLAPLTSTGKLCTKCREDKLFCDFFTSGKKVDGSYKYNSWCKVCIREKMASYHKRVWGKEKLQFSAFKRTKDVRSYLTYLLGKARRRGHCSITIDDLCRLWESQNGRCAITGWQMTMRLADGVVATNASIDRINSEKGYILGNVQIVCRSVNIAKHDLTMDEFLKLCRAATERDKDG